MIFSYYTPLLLLLASFALARVRDIELNLSVGTVDADCSGKNYRKLLVDGEYPGKPIRVTKGDHVRVTVRNDKNSNQMTSIHFHGILQVGTTEADGFPNLTQAEIAPGGVYRQNFQVIDQTGSYFYHAHSGLQGLSVYGPFIVYETDEDWPTNDSSDKKLHEGPYEYDDDLELSLGEWWHTEEKELLDFYLGDNFTGMDVPQSYLLNGRTIFDPSHIPENCEGYSILNVEPGKTYRLRVLGSQLFAGMDITIEKHTFTVFEVDGVLIKPYETDHLPVNSGERFSALLTTNQGTDSYRINVTPFNTPSTVSNGLAILQYTQGYRDIEDIVAGWNASAPLPEIELNASYYQNMQPLEPDHDNFNEAPDRTIVMTPVEVLMPDNTIRWLLNNRTAPEYDPPLLEQLAQMELVQINNTAIDLNKAGLTDGFDEGHQIYPMKVGEIVDIVVHTTMYRIPNVCVGHPWHSHGMVHYAIAEGPGEYVHERAKDLRTYDTPISKDTTYVYQYPPDGPLPAGTPCGWTKVRFYVSNPGLWGFHCHVTGHMVQGMMSFLEVSPEEIPYLQSK